MYLVQYIYMFCALIEIAEWEEKKYNYNYNNILALSKVGTVLFTLYTIPRCTGYRPILDAFKSFASDYPGRSDLPDIEELKLCKRTGAPCAGSCKGAAVSSSGCGAPREEFQWSVPTTLEEVRTILSALPAGTKYRWAAFLAQLYLCQEFLKYQSTIAVCPDPERFDADPDPDRAVYINANPDPNFT